ncbi:MAG: ABC transporter permease [Lentisphaerae bacterium]|nr:ABC transporter permease [Lentisphaerota bacterium]
MFKLLKDLHGRRELLMLLVVRNLKIRYKNSALGFLWTLLAPLCLILVYAVFARVLRFFQNDPLFMPRLVIGIIVWQFLATCYNDALHAIMGNAELVKKSAFPRFILPLSMVLANLLNFLFSAVILVIYLQFVRMPLGPIAWLPLIILTQVALCLGGALIISSLNVFFRDTEHILSVGLLAWFFMTPIIYTIDYWPARFVHLGFLNPMTGLVTAYRAVLMSDSAVGPSFVALSVVVAWSVFVVGVIAFQKAQVRFAEEL